MSRFPKYTDETRKGNEAVVKLINYFDSHHWVHRYKAGLDIGVDIEFEANPNYSRVFIQLHLNGAEAQAFLDKIFRPRMDKVRKSIGEAYSEMKQLYRERLVTQ